jgi:hypothetical protein
VDPHLEELRQEIASVIASLSAEQLMLHAPGKWCVAEILEHLYLTYTGTTKGFNRVLEADKSLATPPTWKHRGQALVVVGFGYLPEGRQSPPAARPRGIPLEEVATGIGPKIVEMDEVMNRCATKFGSRTKLLDHPILGPFSIRQWRKFHLLHGRHHIKQIQRLRQGFGAVRSA